MEQFTKTAQVVAGAPPCETGESVEIEHARPINEEHQASENSGQSTDELQDQLVQKTEENAHGRSDDPMNEMQGKLDEHETRITDIHVKEEDTPEDDCYFSSQQL